MNWTLSKPAFFYFKDWKDSKALFSVFSKKAKALFCAIVARTGESKRTLQVASGFVPYLSCISLSLKKHFAHVSASW